AVQSTGGVRLIKSHMGVCGFHTVAVLGTDAECLYRQFVASTFAHIKGVEGVGNLGFFPALTLIGRVWACPFAEWDEGHLVIVTGKSGRFIILNKCALAAALAAGTDLQ